MSGQGAPSAHRYRFTEAADDDIEGILRQSATWFGPRQRDLYAQLIDRAAELISEDPERPGSRDRPELGTGIRSFHVELAAHRRGAATHNLYYLRGNLDEGNVGVIIARVLHEGMDPKLHVPADPE